ncbi:hypothetical protein LguiA_022442 [Lonicera macranthoides]
MYYYTSVSAPPPCSYPCRGGYYYSHPYPSQHPYGPHQYGFQGQLDPQRINYQSYLLSQHLYAPHHNGFQGQLDLQLINYYHSYLSQHSYAPYQYGSQRQLDPQVISTGSTNLEPTMEYAEGRTYVHFSYPEPMTIILDENGEVVDDYMQFFDEERLKKELIHREEKILKCLKTRTLVKSEDHPKPEEPDICVICQAEYEDNERIGTLECGHEYHVDCIKKWLLQNTLCPICKTTALATIN